jgi:hypothetical protein
MAEFNDKLASLVSLEMSAGTVGDPAKMSCLIESLASSLAFTVAIAAKGEAKAIDHLLEGIDSGRAGSAGSHDRRRTTPQLNRKHP